jgi:hypothetical protein
VVVDGYLPVLMLAPAVFLDAAYLWGGFLLHANPLKSLRLSQIYRSRASSNFEVNSRDICRSRTP